MLAGFKERHSVGKRYLIGVSGGRDSVALADLLVEAGFRKLVFCHLNHGLRGRASGQDAAFVRRMGKRYGMPVEVKKVDVAGRAKRAKDSVETAARRARLEFFVEVAKRHRCGRVLLGHHADDQVETVLMNLFRGAGLEGLEGMREVSVQRVAGREVELIRPLLGWWREDIDAYLDERGLKYRDDTSNAERKFLRNRVRHELLPELAKMFGRDVRGAVWKLGELAAGENDFFRELLEGLEVEGEEIPLKKLRGEPVAVQRRWIRGWLQGRGIRDISFRDVEAVRGAADPESARAKVNLPGGRHARRRAGKLFVE